MSSLLEENDADIRQAPFSGPSEKERRDLRQKLSLWITINVLTTAAIVSLKTLLAYIA